MTLQKHPLLFVSVAFAIGIAISAFFPTLGLWPICLFGLLALLSFFGAKKKVSPLLEKGFSLSILFCVATIGWMLADFAAQIPADDIGFAAGQSLPIEGRVLEEAKKTQYGYKMTLAVEGRHSGKVMLYLPATISTPELNAKIKLDARIAHLGGSNVGYNNWLHHQGIHATANATDFEHIGTYTDFTATLKNWRKQLGNKFSALLPDGKMAGLAKAMLLGDRADLDPALRLDFSSSGLSHILAISGMHLGILYIALQTLLQFLLYIRFGRQIRAVILVLTLVAFALFTGGNPAICRAAMMLGLLELGQSFWQKNYSLNALAISALLFLAIDPQALFSPGFQLSYAAVLGILLFQKPIAAYLQARIKQLPRKLANTLAVTLTAQAATAPLVAYHFHSFPTYFLFANLLLLPIVAIAANIGFAGFVVAWIPGLSSAWAGMLDFCLRLLATGADLLAQLPGATISALDFSQTGIWIFVGQVLLFAAILERKFLQKALGQITQNKRAKSGRIALAGLQMRGLMLFFGLLWALGGFIL